MQTPRSAFKRGGARGSGGKPYEKRQGQFVNGVWQCDCNPRLPAIYFQVKKQGPNHGRWFYTCQKPRDDQNRCKFFLWEEDAQPREHTTLMANTRTEPTTPSINRTCPGPAPSGYQRLQNSTLPCSAGKPPIDSAKKRQRVIAGDVESDEFGIDRDDAAFDLLQQMMDAETPRKVRKTDAITTPTRKLPWTAATDGVPTPPTGEPAEPSVASVKSRSSGVLPASPFNTPTPSSRFKNVGAHAPHADDSIVDEVFNLLSKDKVHLGSRPSAALKTVLQKYQRRAEGSNKSKEVLRLRLKAEEAKNMELSLRNDTLQAELEAAKATVDHLQWEKDQDAKG